MVSVNLISCCFGMLCIVVVESAQILYPQQSGILAPTIMRSPQAMLNAYFSDQPLKTNIVAFKKIKLMKSSSARKLLFEELSSSEEDSTTPESFETTEPESTEPQTTEEPFSHVSEPVTSPKPGQQTSQQFKQDHTTPSKTFPPTPPQNSVVMTEPATSEETSDETMESTTSETATEPETSEAQP